MAICFPLIKSHFGNTENELILLDLHRHCIFLYKCMCVYIKYNIDSSLQTFKARLIAFRQKVGVCVYTYKLKSRTNLNLWNASLPLNYSAFGRGNSLEVHQNKTFIFHAQHTYHREATSIVDFSWLWHVKIHTTHKYVYEEISILSCLDQHDQFTPIFPLSPTSNHNHVDIKGTLTKYKNHASVPKKLGESHKIQVKEIIKAL